MTKTIFIAAFEGVEAKNLLRTSVLSAILGDPDARVVLFMKNEERTSRYKKEFSHDRIFYEVVPRPLVYGAEAFFGKLKFVLLRTETTNLRRRLIFEHRRNYLHYFGGLFLNWLLARPAVRRTARALDWALVRSNVYGPYFDKYRPQAVLLAHLFDEPEIIFLREAKRRGVKTIGLVNSWDKITARCVLRLLPDKLIVPNNVVKEEAILHNEMQEDDIVVTGFPQYDAHFARKPYLQREEFFKKLKLDPDHKLIVYAPEGSAYSESDWHIIDLLYKMNAEKKFGEKVAVLVRFQPNDILEDRELKKRPHLLYDYPGIRFLAKRGIDWDMNFDDLRHLNDTMYHMSLLVCYGSSLAIDAAIFDKPIIHINFEVGPGTALPYKLPTRFYDMTHEKKAFTSGGGKHVYSPGELAIWVKRFLHDPAQGRERRQFLVRQQCEAADGKSGERVGRFILDFIGADK